MLDSQLMAAPPPPRGEVMPEAIKVWLQQRGVLVAQLEQALRDGFQAVAAFNGGAYLDCIERQEGLCRQLRDHDRKQPKLALDLGSRRRAEQQLRTMNQELRELSDVQAALIEHGGRSVRCFQRVWALGAPSYRRPGS